MDEAADIDVFGRAQHIGRAAMVDGVEVGDAGRVDHAGGVDHIDDSVEIAEQSPDVGGVGDVTDNHLHSVSRIGRHGLDMSGFGRVSHEKSEPTAALALAGAERTHEPRPEPAGGAGDHGGVRNVAQWC